MVQSVKRGAARHAVAEHAMRDQEVLRAKRELDAYFRGRRTEREARAALKIIKAFIRERERADPARRRPLPGAEPSAALPDRSGKRKARVKRAPRRAKLVSIVDKEPVMPDEPA